MSIQIDRAALKTILYGTLSCRCSIATETERALCAAMTRSEGGKPRPPAGPEEDADEKLELQPYLDIADRDPARTPLHLFVDFCSYAHEDPDTFVITHDDSLRYFSCRYHFDRMLPGVDPMRIPDPAVHLVGHMLLPVTIVDGENGVCRFRHGDRHDITLRNVFIPPEAAFSAAHSYGFHFGMLLTPLTTRQVTMVERHLGRIPEFSTLAERVREIDYADYQSFGNHHDRIASRYRGAIPR